MKKQIFETILLMDSEEFSKKFSGWISDLKEEGKETCEKSQKKLLEIDGMEEISSGISKLIKGFVGKSKEFGKGVKGWGEEISEDVQEFFGDIDPKKGKSYIAKLNMARKMYKIAQTVGFSPEQAKELAFHYFQNQSLLEKIQKLFPNEHSSRLQELIMGYSRKHAEVSREGFRKELMEAENASELIEDVLKEISINPNLWYSQVSEKDFNIYFSSLYNAYITSIDTAGEEVALENAKESLLRFL